jgi:hypothetical protein
MTKGPRPVKVHWVDSTSDGPGWTACKDLTEPLNLEVLTVGWLVAENEEAVDIAHSWAPGTGEHQLEQVCGRITIPRVAIRSIVDLAPNEALAV